MRREDYILKKGVTRITLTEEINGQELQVMQQIEGWESLTDDEKEEYWKLCEMVLNLNRLPH